MAEADVIRAKGEAEAEAMRVKAAAYHEYNQAAVLDKVITNLPEVVRAHCRAAVKGGQDQHRLDRRRRQRQRSSPA